MDYLQTKINEIFLNILRDRLKEIGLVPNFLGIMEEIGPVAYVYNDDTDCGYDMYRLKGVADIEKFDFI